MAGLKLKHIYKVYSGGVRAVNDFDLDIKDKSFVVLVGPSGCGKSTTLRMIAGLESITSGQLYIDNVLVNEVESKNRDIAMVFQSYALYPHMTVYQNMGFGLKLRHEKPQVIKDKVLKAAEILEISELLDRKPKELSGGQRQRVALGRAIVREPNVFLLDEPLSNLDAKLRVQMRTEITKLHEKLQTTFIYVTHDQTEAMTMGDTIVVMNKGFIQQADAPITLFEDPANLFVATFLGSPQMNIIEGELIKDKDNIGVKLEGVDANVVWLRKETAKQITRSKLSFDKKYFFGIRPDHISIVDKGIPAHVEAVEQLGDETLIYAKIENHQKNIVLKTSLNASVSSQDDIFVKFNNERVYLFDEETEHSLIGLPSFNKLQCSLTEDEIKLGKLSLPLNEEIKSHLMDQAYEGQRFLSIKPEYIELEASDNSLPVEVNIDFIEERTNYNIAYALIDGLEEYIVFRMPKNLGTNAKTIKIYLPNNHVLVTDEEDNSLLSREIIFKNSADAVVSTDKNGLRRVSISGGETLVYDKLDVQDGQYEFVLKQDKCQVVFPKKARKQLGVEPTTGYNPKQTLTVSCYDEEPMKTKNIAFVQIKGFKEYVSLLFENNFSVYKMPKFKIIVPPDGFELK